MGGIVGSVEVLGEVGVGISEIGVGGSLGLLTEGTGCSGVEGMGSLAGEIGCGGVDGSGM